MASSFDVTMHGTVIDPDPAFEKALSELLAQYGGSLTGTRFTPTGSGLPELNLRSRILVDLSNAGIKTPADLAAMTMQQIHALYGVSWRGYREIWRALGEVGLSPRGALPYPESLESLEVDDGIVRRLKQKRDQGQIHTLADLTKVDMVTVFSLLENRHDLTPLRTRLRERGLDFAPLSNERTVGELMAPDRTGCLHRLVECGLPATTRLSALSISLINELKKTAKYEEDTFDRLTAALVTWGFDIPATLTEI